MLQQRQRSRANRQQSWMLALGCGSSMVLHLGLIAGISYWWRSPAPVDEPIEITLVEPTEIEPIAVASPPVAKPPKISITNPPAQVAPKQTVLKSVSKPILVTPTPKRVAVVVKPISKPIRATAQPKPRSSSIPTKVKPNSSPIQTAKVNHPVNTNPIVKPFPIAPKTFTPKSIQTPLIDNSIATPLASKSVQSQPKIKTTPNPPFTFPTPQLRSKTTAVPTPLDRSISKNSRSQQISPPIPVKPNSQAAIPKSPPATSPDEPIIPTTTSDLSSPMSPKSQTRSTTIAQPPAGGNIPNNDNKPIFNRDLLPGGGLTRNGGQFNSPQASNLQPQNSSPPSGNGDRERVGSAAPGVDSSSSTSQTAGGGGLQCIERCQIPKLRDLQDRDGGKDRLRIRIVIDPNGSVLEATIAKSSDNPQIDAVVLAGIRQMQFKPPGKIIKGIIKANILL